MFQFLYCKSKGEGEKKWVRKGQFTVVHWILVAVLGVIILFMAFIFASKTGSVEDYKSNTVMANYLDLLLNPFTSIGAVAGSVSKTVEFPSEISVKLSCVGDRQILTVGKKNSAAHDIYDKYIFSDSEMGLKKAYVFSIPLGLPFRVTDFIFILPSDKRYCMLYTPQNKNFVSSLIIDLREELPDEAWGSFALCSSKACCPAKARVISFSENFENIADLTIIDKSGGSFSYGEVVFGNEKSYFISRPFLLAAVFSDSFGNYDCNFRRVAKKVSSVSGLYARKADFLDQTQDCSYAILKGEILKLKFESEALNAGPSSQSVKELFAASNEIERINSRLGCAQVY